MDGHGYSAKNREQPNFRIQGYAFEEALGSIRKRDDATSVVVISGKGEQAYRGSPGVYIENGKT